MADLVPVVTNISDPATWNAAGIIDALIAHTWTNWTIGVSTAGQGIALTCDAVGENQTVIIRKLASGDANKVAVSIEPTQVIDDPGDDTPSDPTTSEGGAGTALGADWSDDGQWDVTLGAPAAGSKVWVKEYLDTILILITNSANTFYVSGCLAGRPIQPFDANSSALGQDGLGFFIGAPAVTAAATANLMFSKSVDAAAGLLHYETNRWGTRSQVTQPTGVWAGDGTDSETNIFSPPLPTWCDIGGQEVSIGNVKYCRIVGTLAVPKTIKAVSASNQGYLHVNDDAGADYFTFITDKTKTP